MASKIEWLKGGESWNFFAGCQKQSAGCANCYARGMARRLAKNPEISEGTRQAYQTAINSKTGEWSGQVAVIPGKLELPKIWKTRKLIFVESMADLFYEKVPEYWIEKAFQVMFDCPQHIFVVLTKRAHRMAEILTKAPWWVDRDPFERRHIWLSTTVEHEQTIYRVRDLCRIPARVRVVSAEPLIGPITGLGKFLRGPDLLDDGGDRDGIHGVFTGGETGPKARPMLPHWARKIRQDCEVAQAAFFHKHNGEFRVVAEGDACLSYQGQGNFMTIDEGLNWWGTATHNVDGHEMLADVVVERVGKAKAGRRLDDQIWDDLPEGM